MKKLNRFWMAVIVTAGAAAGLFLARRSVAEGSSVIEVDRGRREVRIKAVAHPSHLSRSFVQPGHHAVVWEKGRAHYGALFESHVSDHDVGKITDTTKSRKRQYRGKRCEPACVKEISEVAAQVKNCWLEELSKATCATAKEFFRKIS